MTRTRRKTMPANMVAAADAAIARHQKRPGVAPIEFRVTKEGWELDCPFRDVDKHKWEALLFEAFGTRSGAIMEVFTRQLANLVRSKWNTKREVWVPSSTELVAAVQMVAGFRVRNEPQAALAAQMVAIHLATMKLAAMVGGRSYIDDRTAATLSRLARTFAMQMDTMNRVQGKGRSSRQKIIVKHEKHIHQHQHVHIEGGAAEFGGQPDATKETHGVQKSIERAAHAEERPALPGPDAGGTVVSLCRGEGEEGLPDARRSSRVGRSEG